MGPKGPNVELGGPLRAPRAQMQNQEGRGALGPIGGGASGRPKADIMEAEGRLNEGLGAEPPGIKKF